MHLMVRGGFLVFGRMAGLLRDARGRKIAGLEEGDMNCCERYGVLYRRNKQNIGVATRLAPDTLGNLTRLQTRGWLDFFLSSRDSKRVHADHEKNHLQVASQVPKYVKPHKRSPMLHYSLSIAHLISSHLFTI